MPIINANHQCPLLSRVTSDSLSVAASSGSIECSFSTATDILTAKRNRTKPDLFGNLICYCYVYFIN
ncbi:hypothetical protein OUZ56_005470 [Daphnia magna]|uniref:HAT C-terminal dimerisation domain-containing protein n=1 Tax=Daphnia magna TaxID=35525 RepID=A0ABQ9YTD4_9CRUS|nr:hypothetical protein OUZ56_005470 [Daphnia magna]